MRGAFHSQKNLVYLWRKSFCFQETYIKIPKYLFLLTKSRTFFRMSKMPLAAIRKASICSLFFAMETSKLLPSAVLNSVMHQRSSYVPLITTLFSLHDWLNFLCLQYLISFKCSVNQKQLIVLRSNGIIDLRGPGPHSGFYLCFPCQPHLMNNYRVC